MNTASRVLSPCCALLATPVFRLKTAAAQEHSEPQKTFEKIHLSGAQEQRWPRSETYANHGDVIRSVPIFPLGRISFIPHSGTENLHVFEPRYRKLYIDMLGWTARLRWPFFKNVKISVSLPWQQATQPTRPCLVNVWMDVDHQGKFVSSVGVLLDVTSWKRVGMFPPRYNAVHHSGSRVRILRIVNPEAVSNIDNYLMADIEVIQDKPQPREHAETLRAWRAVWASIRALIDLQTNLDVRPRLSRRVLDLGRDRTLLFPNSCWLDEEDVWKPVGVVQELCQTQVLATHKKYMEAIRRGWAAGDAVDKLQHAYDMELQRLDQVWEGIHCLLQEESVAKMLWELSQIVDAEVERLQALNASVEQAP
mmetsp:Transcript_115521/g.204135  ORF Transcript_115521/g.204135 Transcript_115521/m.204135 type:complete len:365 (+) Transcript_115521:38-1132(+)